MLSSMNWRSSLALAQISVERGVLRLAKGKQSSSSCLCTHRTMFTTFSSWQQLCAPQSHRSPACSAITTRTPPITASNWWLSNCSLPNRTNRSLGLYLLKSGLRMKNRGRLAASFSGKTITSSNQQESCCVCTFRRREKWRSGVYTWGSWRKEGWSLEQRACGYWSISAPQNRTICCCSTEEQLLCCSSPSSRRNRASLPICSSPSSLCSLPCSPAGHRYCLNPLYHSLRAIYSIMRSEYNRSYKMETLKQVVERLGGDPYEILGTAPDADFAVLRKNYRTLALKYHPDRNKDDEATEQFIKINRAYEFLEEESNRRLYADHIRALEEQRQRIANMDAERRTLIEQLKRREEEHLRAKEDLQAQAKRRKEFFEKKEREEEERERLRRQISQEMTPQQYYQQMSAVVVRWQRGLSFTQKMLAAALAPYGQLVSLQLEPTRRRATAVFNSIERAAAIAAEFRHPLVSVELEVSGQRRRQLLGALKRRKEEVDLSLSSDNIARLKDIINRTSNLYFQHPPPE